MSAALQNSRTRKNNRQQNNASSRGSYQNANNFRRETPEPETPSGVFADQRTAGMMCSILGTQTTVKTVNGKTYKGRTTGFSEKGDIALADAKLEDNDGTPGPNIAGLIIQKDNFVVCRTNGVDLKGLSTSSDFTDSGIVSRMNGSSESQLKELQPWQDDDAGEISASLSLDDRSGGWDSTSMFARNKEMFNLSSTYDENMKEYTTRLPEPGTEAYAAKERFAKQKAEEIERDEGYQRRIAKELSDHDEDSKFSFVHRDDSHSPHRSIESNSNKNVAMYPSRQSYPPMRNDRDREEHIRNGNMHRGQGRGGLQRQNSPFSSGSNVQQNSHHVNNSRQAANNHYQQGPALSGPLNRNQGHGPNHLRHQQQQQQAPPPHQGPVPSSQNHSGPPPHHFPNQPQHVSQTHSQHRISQHQQMVSPTQPPPGKPPHHLPAQTVPSSSSPVSSHQPPSIQKTSSQQPLTKSAQSPSQNVNGVSSNQQRQASVELNGDLLHAKAETKPPSGPFSEVASPTTSSSVCPGGPQVNQQQQHHSTISTSSTPVTVSSASSSAASAQQKLTPSESSAALVSSTGQQQGPKAGQTPGPSSAPTVHPGRGGRGSDSNPEEARSKIAEFQDFKEKFKLEPPKSEDSGEPPSSQATSPPAVPQPASPQSSRSPGAGASATQSELSESTSEASSAEKKEDSAPTVKTSKLNPNAKEFKPKAPVEAQSPSPQPRSSPHVHQMQYPAPPIMMSIPPAVSASYIMNPQRKRANVDHLTHQVQGQPLIATQPPITPMMYIQGAPGYQIMGRVPNSLAMVQGQHVSLDQAGAQNQPQPMFAFQWPLDLNPSAHVEGAAVPAQQQPIPAHLPHPQPAHAPPMQQQPPVQAAQPAHVPNPAPSPVHQHQHPQHNGQPGLQQQPQHHQIGQGPPQSVTPQPAHFMNYPQHGMPRTSLAGGAGGQQSLAGHPAAVSISYMSGAPQYSYQNANSGPQYPFAPAAAATPPQPQTSQNSSHGQGGSHPQYVVMPHTTPQGHPPMQQHSGQAYSSSGLQFHHQHNLMQGPPQMPPNHGHNPNQAGPHLLQHGMPAGLHQSVAGSQPGMFMPMPSTPQLFPHQQ
ncbi:ataxin-2 [Elysia marginata]|uniref:Ataxin-2 n=1 Tax=Elysia marginata TaxID=1093978 RepID=A0AAV4EJH9_9GAST|nr:ataxin-2 [Elysia marginata]